MSFKECALGKVRDWGREVTGVLPREPLPPSLKVHILGNPTRLVGHPKWVGNQLYGAREHPE